MLAGGNAVGVRVSNRELDPLWGAGLRFFLAACLLGAMMAVMKLTLPHGSALVGVLLYGALTFGGGFAFAYYALVRIHAGLGQTLLALVPLATLLLAVLQRQERLRFAAVVGTLLSLVGIGVVAGVSGSEAVPALSLLAALGAVLCFAQATVLVRQFPPVHPVTTNAVGMAIGATILVTLSLLLNESLVLPEDGATWLALAYLVVLGSGPVFVLYLVVVRLWSASRAAYTFVADPARHRAALRLDRRRADRRGARDRRSAGPGRRVRRRASSLGYAATCANFGMILSPYAASVSSCFSVIR